MRARAHLVPTLLSACVIGCNGGTADTPITVPPVLKTPATLAVLGSGEVGNRYTAEISVGGRYAYSSTWGTRSGVRGNAVFVWDVGATVPILIDSIIVADAGTLGDIQFVPEANLLVVAVEPAPRGAIVLYDASNPAKPQLLGRYETASTVNGVHTAQVASVSGRLYAFLSIDPRGADPAKLLIVDITDPRAPVERWSKVMGTPFVHDVHVRDGILLTAEWNDGMGAYDIGGGGKGGTPSSPVLLGKVQTLGGSAHNVFWLRDAASGSRYALVGEEGPGAIGQSSVGDVHVIDVSSWTAMREVGYFRVEGAGTHNFWVDESAGVLYAAYYNAGIRAFDVRGDMSTCTGSARDGIGRCNLVALDRAIGKAEPAGAFVWGVDGGANGSIMISDMLRGIVRVARAVPIAR